MSDTGGATAIEYALIGTIISIVIITSLTSIGAKLAGYLAAVGAGLN